MAAPHETTPPVHLRRGGFWLPGDLQPGDEPWQLGPAWVQWEAPAESAALPPLVFVHGGGGQSTDWLGTAGTGWAHHAVSDGFPAYLLDRPGHGRSPWDPARLGGKTAFPDYRGLRALFVPASHDPRAAAHTAWPWGREPGDSEADAQVASSGGMLLDTALGHELDARRLLDLLARTGPAVVITHSAGAPAGWLAADRAPESMLGLVSVEPIGPPFRDLAPRGTLADGLTAIPLTRENERLPRLAATPVCVVTGSASGHAAADRDTVAHLVSAGVSVDHLDLAAEGLLGRGHGLIFEHDNRAVFNRVTRWLTHHVLSPAH